MSYLEEAIYCIEQKDGAAFYTLSPTNTVDPSTSLEAIEYAEKFYQKDQLYTGPLHAVAQQEGNEWRIMVMEE